ncbi:SWI/SNF complex component [Vairimorpha necatrix]|uniref:SWI/SNF complex component n=1 Tax=Vairimorpha necatrix TaxID=6039 RepID=A0AAX4JFP7_9MICR
MTSRYENLKKVENQINDLCLLKRLKIEAEHRKRIKCTKTLRLYINSYSDSDGFFFRLDSRVLNDFKNNREMKLSDLIERIYLIRSFKDQEDEFKIEDDLKFKDEFKFEDDLYKDQDDQRDSSNKDQEKIEDQDKIEYQELHDLNSNEYNNDVDDICEWMMQGDDVESFEFRSKNAKFFKLVLVLNNSRDIMKLSPSLSSLLQVSTCSKPNLLGLFYKYAIKNNLLDKDSLVTCTEELRNIFKVDSFKFTDLPELVDDHLYPLDNIEILVQDGCYDIILEVDDLFQHPKVHHKDVYNLERRIDTTFEIKNNLEKRRRILEDFSFNPLNFINKWISVDLEEFSNKTGVFRDERVQNIMYELLKDVL